MRHITILSACLLLHPIFAQQITNVTVQPSPLHACVPITFTISGTSAGGLAVDFVESNFGETSVALTLTVTTGPGSSPYSTQLGPYTALSEGEYALVFKLKRNGNITSTWTGTLTVLAPVLPNMGDPTSINVCPNDPPFLLLSRLNGNPDPGGSWLSPAVQTVPDGMFYPGTSLEGSYMYYIEMPAPCETQFQTLSITYLPNNTAGLDGTATLCPLPGGAPVDLSQYLGGSPDPGGTWSGPNTTGIFIPGVSPAGDYVYQVAGIPPCPDPTATVTVVAATPNEAGTGSEAVFCFDETAALMTPYITGAQTTGLWYDPSGTPVAYFVNPIDVSTSGPGEYAYIVDTPPCPADTAYVTVTLDGPPCTLGIGQADLRSPSLHIMPNPASGLAMVEVERADVRQGLSIIVTDAGGRVVLREALPAATNIRQALDLSSLAGGVYTVRILGDATFPARRLIVQQ
ncbi:MAG: T9SS type A sorting domain-containing protein [Flavobacteriales bacterium]|nr:T9SS type A sorting domain-containing protein [Flavobacteriales bacterium]MEB2341504.1 hypothetical protein [Flavobacteriia bacterium]